MLNVKDYCLIYIIHLYSKYINLFFQINYFVKMGDFLLKNIPIFSQFFSQNKKIHLKNSMLKVNKVHIKSLKDVISMK